MTNRAEDLDSSREEIPQELQEAIDKLANSEVSLETIISKIKEQRGMPPENLSTGESEKQEAQISAMVNAFKKISDRDLDEHGRRLIYAMGEVETLLKERIREINQQVKEGLDKSAIKESLARYFIRNHQLSPGAVRRVIQNVFEDFINEQLKR